MIRERSFIHLYERAYGHTAKQAAYMTLDEADRAMTDLRTFIEQAEADGVDADLLRRPRRDWLEIYERWASFKFDDQPTAQPEYREAAE